MLPIDPGDGQGSVTPTQPVTPIVPLQATPHGGTIIRPGAVAWGGRRDARRHLSCEAIERALAAAAASPAALPALLTELGAARLWVPLPAERRPFTDGTAVRLPLVTRDGTDFVPCFTSVLRLTAWADQADTPGQRSGDPRTVPPAVVPHIVVPAPGLAGRLPAGLGIAVNPDGVPGLPLYPECVPHLAGVAVNGQVDPQVVTAWIACNSKRLYTVD
jgi:hypothetical protein